MYVFFFFYLKLERSCVITYIHLIIHLGRISSQSEEPQFSGTTRGMGVGTWGCGPTEMFLKVRFQCVNFFFLIYFFICIPFLQKIDPSCATAPISIYPSEVQF